MNRDKPVTDGAVPCSGVMPAAGGAADAQRGNAAVRSRERSFCLLRLKMKLGGRDEESDEEVH